MRPAALLSIAFMAFLLAPTVPGQSMTFPEDHQIRAAYGDIPTSLNGTVEADGQWNFEQRMVLAPGDAEAKFFLPPGHTFGNVACDCIFGYVGSETEYSVTRGNTTDEAVVYFSHSIEGTPDAFGTRLIVTGETRVIIYAETTAFLHAASEVPTSLPTTTDPSVSIYDFGTGLPGAFWFTVSPAAVAAQEGPDGGFDLMSLGIGVVLGVLVWYVLVSRGMVQKRQRKQVAATAAHKQAASSEPKATLEGRKRVLMAALKELEVAKMNKEIDTEAYDALKADFKKQTVTVMRAIEEG